MTTDRELQIIEKTNQARMLVNQVFPIDPILIAKAMGLEVFTTALPRNVSGKVLYKEKKILIEQTDLITRQIFSVAVQIGHYVLHNDETSHTSLRATTTSQGNDIKEKEANYFATNLLMPKDEVLHLVGLNFVVDSMASYFGVSTTTMQYHLKDLGVSVYI